MSDPDDPFVPSIEPRAPAHGALPIYAPADVWELVPATYKESQKKPVLDAFVEALTEIALGWEDAGTEACAESDVASASGAFLDGLADDRDIFRQPDETDGPLRARTLVAAEPVDRLSTVAAVNAILLPFTEGKAHIFDSVLDRWFITDGTARFHSLIGCTPFYPDRLYPCDAVANGGAVRLQSEPGGTYAGQNFRDMVGRGFVLRVPDISSIDKVHAYVFDASTHPADDGTVEGADAADTPYDPRHRMFVGTELSWDSGNAGRSFLSRGNRTALSVYQTIADKVNALCGHGVRWALIVDPKLTRGWATT
jgi:hypothetical protein